MASSLQEFYDQFDEPVKGTMLYLRRLILKMNDDMTEALKYGGAFFLYRGKNVCYLWYQKKTGTPYIGFMHGRQMHHPALIAGDRKVVKSLLINPEIDLNEPLIKEVILEALKAAQA